MEFQGVDLKMPITAVTFFMELPYGCVACCRSARLPRGRAPGSRRHPDEIRERTWNEDEVKHVAFTADSKWFAGHRQIALHLERPSDILAYRSQFKKRVRRA